MTEKFKRAVVVLLSIMLVVTMSFSSTIAAVFAETATADENADSNEIRGNDSVEFVLEGTYISEHFNKKYVKRINPDAFLMPKTYARTNAVYTKKAYDELVEGKQQKNVIAGFNYATAIYDVDPDSDYYVALANARLGEDEPYYSTAIYNNDRAEKLDDVIFEDSIAYIPKEHIDKPSNEHELFDEEAPVAMQFAYRMEDAFDKSGKADFSGKIRVLTLDENTGEYDVRRVRLNNLMEPDMTLDLDVEHPKDYAQSDLVISVNGNAAPLTDEQFHYDRESGKITINAAGATTSSVMIIVKEKGLLDRAGEKIADATAEAVHGLSHDDMFALKNSKGNYVILSNGDDDNTKTLYQKLYVGWRGVYDGSDVSGTKYSTHYSPDESDLKKGFYSQSKQYLYAGSSKTAAWAIISYAIGQNALNYDSSNWGKNTKYKKLKPYEWLLKYRKSLIGTHSGENGEYKRTGGKDHDRLYNKKTGHSQGGMTFAFQFPEKITGVASLVDDAHASASGYNQKKVNINIDASGVDQDNGNLWLAGWCRHFDDDADEFDDKGEQWLKGNIYVTCIGKGEDGTYVNSKCEDGAYVILAFTFEQPVGTKSQTGGAIYKFYVEDESAPGTAYLRVKKSSTKPGLVKNLDDYSTGGATFEVIENGKVIDEITTGAPGSGGYSWTPKLAVSLESAEATRTFTIREKDPPVGHKNANPKTSQAKTVTVANGKTAPVEFEFTNEPRYGGLKIVKKPKNKNVPIDETYYSLQNAVFNVVGPDKNGETTTYTVSTNQQGVAELSNIPFGHYVITEKTPSKGFDKYTGSVAVDVEEDKDDPTAEIETREIPEPNKGKLTVIKKSKRPEWTDNNPNYDFANGKFKVYDSAGTEVATLTSTSAGTTETITVTPGTYTVEEVTAPPKGYKLPETEAERKKTAVVTENDYINPVTFEFTDPPKTVRIKALKKSSDEAASKDNPNYHLDGAEFTFKSTDVAGFTAVDRTSGEDGNTGVVEVPLGTFTATETKAPTGFRLPSNPVSTPMSFTNENADQYKDDAHAFVFQMSDPPQYGNIGFKKIAEYAWNHTKKAPEKGARFVIWNCSVTSNKVEAQERGDRYYRVVTQNGDTFTSAEKLALGTYIVEQVPDVGDYKGVMQPMIPVRVTLKADSRLQNPGNENIEIWKDLTDHLYDTREACAASPSTLKNDEHYRFHLVLHKMSEDYILNHFEVSDFIKDTRATFKVEVIDDDGTLTSARPIGEYTTDATGYVTIKGPGDSEDGLEAGTYRITETDVTPGFYNNPSTSVLTVELRTDGVIREISQIGHDNAASTKIQDLSPVKEEYDRTKRYQITWTKLDTPQYTRLKVKKVRKYLNEFGKQETTPQPNVEFVLFADGDITSYDSHHNHVYYRDGKPIQGMILDEETGEPTYYLDGKVVEDPTDDQIRRIRIITDKNGEWDCSDTCYPLTNAGFPDGAQSKYRMKEMYIWKTGDHISFTKVQKIRLIKIWNENGFDENTPLEEADGMTFSQILNYGIDVTETESTDAGGSVSKKGLSSNQKYIEDKEPTNEYPTYKFFMTRIVNNIQGDGDQDIVNDNGEELACVTRNQTVLSPAEAATYVEPSAAVPPVESTKDHTEYTFNITNDRTPSIKTTAYFSGDQKVIPNSGKVTFMDKVEYRNLYPNITYKLEARLIDKATQEEVRLSSGKALRVTHEFTPKTKNGVEIVEFPEVDASLFEGDTVVYEVLKETGTEVVRHEDITDEGQTVEHEPEIRTMAEAGGEKSVAARGEVTITDTVSYRNLRAGQVYTMTGRLMGQDGKEIPHVTSNPQVFTAEASSGTVTMSFTFDATGMNGKNLVVFERCYLGEVKVEDDAAGDEPVAVHEDLNDKNQTIQFSPEFRTTAIDGENETHNGVLGETSTIIDTVEYKGLEPGKKYIMYGRLMDKATGEPLASENGETLPEVSQEFTPNAADGSMKMTFTVDSRIVAGKDVVVFEEGRTERGVLVGYHTDITDEAQTVRYPKKLGTTAADKETASHIGTVGEKCHVVDKVEYRGLEPKKSYKIVGRLIDKETGKPIQGEEGEIVKEQSFRTDSGPDGEVTMTFLFDSTALIDKSVVVYEYVYNNEDVLVAYHEDIDDKEQTIEFQKSLKTTATDEKTGTHVGTLGEKVTLRDVVEYHGLLPDTEYVMIGRLMDKATGKPVQDEKGKDIVVEKRFSTKDSPDGTTEIEFEVDTNRLQGKRIVVFEEVKNKAGIVVAFHRDLSDAEQSIRYPDKPGEKNELKTTAVDAITGTKQGIVSENDVITDRVAYKGLKKGGKYTLKATLVDRKSGKPIKINGDAVMAKHAFVAEKENGTVDVEIKYDSRKMEGISAVVFERLYRVDGNLIGSHEDLNDRSQTIYYGKIHTTATVNGKHKAKARGTVTIRDEVRYRNLIPGEKYRLDGILMDKKSGNALIEDGREVTASKEFVAVSSSGSVVLSFKVKAGKLKKKKIVVFEKCLDTKDNIIATHEDLNDKEQTVRFGRKAGTVVIGGGDGHSSGVGSSGTVDTGDTTGFLMYFLLFAAAGTVLGYLFWKKRKEK